MKTYVVGDVIVFAQEIADFVIVNFRYGKLQLDIKLCRLFFCKLKDFMDSPVGALEKKKEGKKEGKL